MASGYLSIKGGGGVSLCFVLSQGRPLSRAGALSEIRETNCELFDRCFFRRINLGSSVVDPHHINADPDPDPSFQIKVETLEKVLK